MKKVLTIISLACVTFFSLPINLDAGCPTDPDGLGVCVALEKFYVDPITGEPYSVVIDYYCSDRSGTNNKCVVLPE